MKYAKAFYFIAQIGLILLAMLFGLRMLGTIMVAVTPVIDSIIRWMSDHALVGGLTLAIGFVVFWFGEECERQMRKERRR